MPDYELFVSSRSQDTPGTDLSMKVIYSSAATSCSEKTSAVKISM